MSGIILHHYGTSPFSEKVRVAFGIKQAAWQSVKIPTVMPKPDLTLLTGAYRKTPVMQVGADIYCDTQIIRREIERRLPTPTLFPGPAKGLAEGVAFWADHQLFQASVAVTFGAVGDQPSLADLAVYHCVWFVRDRAKATDLADYTALNVWADRMKGFGHGSPSDLDSKAAVEIAKTATPAPLPAGVAANAMGLSAGMAVSVTPDDTGRDATLGELVGLTAQSITIAREAPEIGRVHVHFPRAGFILVPHKS